MADSNTKILGTQSQQKALSSATLTIEKGVLGTRQNWEQKKSTAVNKQ
ncbi:hypothetical protein PSSHI_25360 [Photobacterium sp. R1]